MASYISWFLFLTKCTADARNKIINALLGITFGAAVNSPLHCNFVCVFVGVFSGQNVSFRLDLLYLHKKSKT